MSVIYKPLTGYGISSMNIGHTTVWSDLFSTSGEMRFYKGKISDVVDVSRGEDAGDLYVYIYPHNDKDCATKIVPKEKELIALYEKLEKTSNADCFSINIEKMQVIYSTDFEGFFADKEQEFNAFIFHTEDRRNGMPLGFPRIFVLQASNTKGNYKDIGKVQATASRTLSQTATGPTLVGKKFTFMLLNSWNHRKEKLDFPNIDHLHIPTSKMIWVSSLLKTDDFEKFSANCGCSSLLVTKSGTESPDEIVEGEIVEQMLNAIEKEEPQGEKPSPFGYEDLTGIGERIVKDARDKNTVNMTDLCAYGIKDSIAILPIVGAPVNVELDISGVVKKMCVYDGKIYVMPMSGEADWGIFFNEDSDLFVEIENESDFPTNKYRKENL